MAFTEAEFEKRVKALWKDLDGIWDGLGGAAGDGVLRRLADALSRENRMDALQAVSEMADRIDEQAASSLRRHGRDVYEAEAERMADKVGIAFDVVNPRVFDWVSSHVGEMVREIGGETRKAVQATVRRAFDEGWSTRQAAEEIRQSVGLTSRMEQAVSNYRESLVKDGLKPSRVEKKVDLYRREKTRQRAENIARTEIINSAAAGQQEAWAQALERGALDASTHEVRWSTSPGDACPVCVSRDGQRREINGKYPGGFGHPTAHPSCRCVEVLVKKRSATPEKAFYNNLDRAKPVPAVQQRGKIDVDWAAPQQPPKSPPKPPAPPVAPKQPAVKPQTPTQKPPLPDQNATPATQSGTTLPKGGLKPLGTPVSNALTIEGKGMLKRVKKEIEDAVAVVDRVHGDGNLPGIPVNQNSRTATNGNFTFKVSGKPVDIGISKNGEHVGLTTLHEIGHFLDFAGVPKPQGAAGLRWMSHSGLPDGGKLMKAIADSDAVKSLKGLKAGPSEIDVQRGGGSVKGKVPKQYIDYLLKDHELFARAYAQWVATASQDPNLLAQLSKRIEMSGSSLVAIQDQWRPDDFKPIAEAFESLFRGMGWVK